MKKDFFDYMLKVMKDYPDVYFLLGGLGYPRLDEFLKKYPGRTINCEASEQTMMDMAVGLAYANKYPITYTITPFYYRAFETLRTYTNHEKLPMLLIGAGRDDDYSKHDGYSHDAKDIPAILSNLKAIVQYYPDSVSEMEEIIHFAVRDRKTGFVSIRR
jgi:transketolase C-terminal domain/subunit